MINIETLLSTFDKQGTLLKWLQKLEAAMSGATLTSVTVNTLSATEITLTFNFADETSITSPTITLPRGEQGEQGEQGEPGTDGVTPSITAAATVDDNVGTPEVSVSKSGTDEAPTFTFNFSGLKGETGEQGPRGVQGEQGEPGTSFTISGQVDTVADLPTASVELIGTAYFVGETAPRDLYVCVQIGSNLVWENEGTLQGPTGQGYNYMGDWVADNEYYAYDCVTYEGSTYVCIYDINGSTTPPDQDGDHWALFAAKGETGATGPQGEQGEPGEDGTDGVTPDITATATVDDTTGTPAVDVVKTGSNEAPTFTFNFSGLKGSSGQGKSYYLHNIAITGGSQSLYVMCKLNIITDSEEEMTAAALRQYLVDNNLNGVTFTGIRYLNASGFVGINSNTYFIEGLAYNTSSETTITFSSMRYTGSAGEYVSEQTTNIVVDSLEELIRDIVIAL